MAAYKDFFAGKYVTLMGLGLLGRGVGDAEFLAPLCKELVVTDHKNELALAPSLERLKKFSNIRYALGGHQEADFIDTDMVIKAAGVPLGSPYIAAAQHAGVPVYMSTALFAKFAGEAGATIAGVTGTRGKSTVTHLIYHALKQVGKRAHLGGNVRGFSTLAMLPDVQQGDIAVLELDSWQLQGFGDLKISPQIAVFTNLMDDHLNYYDGDVDAYFWDKANIFISQKSGDKLIVGTKVLAQVQKANPPVTPLVPPPLPHDWRLQLIGEHNKENAALAALVLRILGLSEDEIKSGLESFEPVEGRLQKIAEIKGITFYNDNNATTPEATMAALKSFNSKVVLIAGGADKELPLDALVQEIQNYAKLVILLPGTGTEKLKKLLKNYTEVKTMFEAIATAMVHAQTGDIILLSPAFASFGLFKNEYDRNDQFVAVVKKLQ
ncbi:MAG: UDP-N-acetylmuramoyl-L-alanine--D-glutamate ligase [bacterium]|nr:UDP-N-acetylmuramoyl-L-alanine--D-glutamate ligase [bacterium]